MDPKNVVIARLTRAEDEISFELGYHTQFISVEEFHGLSILRTKLQEIRKDIERGHK